MLEKVRCFVSWCPLGSISEVGGSALAFRQALHNGKSFHVITQVARHVVVRPFDVRHSLGEVLQQIRTNLPHSNIKEGLNQLLVFD